MDHRWDESTWQDRASRGERERYSTSRIARDPDVERRDQLLAAERQRSLNQSPWAIGEAWHDQRDLYTRNASIDSDGYGRGPSIHPEEGSYAYQREIHPETIALHASHASIHEREAWPWLNYKDPEEDPYFAHLHEHEHEHRHEGGLWKRLTDLVSNTLHAGSAPRQAVAPELSDGRLLFDVETALIRRTDIDASDIEVTAKAGEVTLEGTVTDRRSKRIAEEVVEGVRGVHDVHNRLTIRHDDPTDADVAFVLPLAMLGT
jgi:hypothetical protein